MKYSICTTVYNAAPRVRASLESILRYINSREFEIVVVDSKSTDGTREILREYAKEFPNFKIIIEKCSRGRGRQIAFENSQGEYIIPVDLDTTYLPQWWELIKSYEKWDHRDKYALQAIYSGVYPRHLLEKVGGWRDLQYAEDFDLWWRLIEIDALKIYPLVTGKNWVIKERESIHIKNILDIIYRKYLNERDRFIARSEFNLSARLREIKMWSKKYSYYLFWIPLVSLARIATLLKNVERRDANYVISRWFSNFVDMDINGDIIYNFITFPQVSHTKGMIKIGEFKAEV